jgi:hypothetical protein
MNPKSYERECVLRSRRFRRDFAALQRKAPRLFREHAEAFAHSDAEQRARRVLETKYPAVAGDHFLAALQPFPLVFDPAWKVCVDYTCGEWWAQTGVRPQGLVTRVGIESPEDGVVAGVEEIYRRARKAFAEMDGESRRFFRTTYAPAVLRQVRLLAAITGQTTWRDVERLWPALRAQQRARYRGRVRAQALRRTILRERLLAHDLLQGNRVPLGQAARTLHLHPRTLSRRRREAQQDIEKDWSQDCGRSFYDGTIFEGGRLFVRIEADTTLEQLRRLWPIIRRAKRACYGDRAHRVQKAERSSAPTLEPITAGDFTDHPRTCATCRNARTSEDYCDWMQDRLWASSGKIKGGRMYEDTEVLGKSQNPEDSILELIDLRRSEAKEDQQR